MFENVEEHVAQLIREEEQELQRTIESLRAQYRSNLLRLENETKKAKDLTSKIVAARTDEEKQLWAMDESISHTLSGMKETEVMGLAKLLDRPYFARLVIEEKEANGVRNFQYKLGYSSNTDCRIIDWRKAPLARLYYEYQEGEEFEEVIQGRERAGTISIRHKLQIKEGELLEITCRFGTFHRENGSWKAGAGRRVSSRGSLPDVLSLISSDQYEAITEEKTGTSIIQGIAGSGKTTVALYQLSWLIKESDLQLNAEQCLFLVRSSSLKEYVSNSLSHVQLEGVQVAQYRDWAEKLLRKLAPGGNQGQSNLPQPKLKRRQLDPSVLRVKTSLGLLKLIERSELSATGGVSLVEAEEILLELLSRERELLELDSTGLLDRELLRNAKKDTEAFFRSGHYDIFDLPLLLRIVQASMPELASFDYICADEVQDYSAVQLATLKEAVKDFRFLTLAGDTSQQTHSSGESFPGWEALRRSLTKSERESVHDVKLLVSHRSTLPIMRLAEHVSGQKRATGGRSGKRPLWFKCRSEDDAVGETIRWLERVTEKFPDCITAVVCKTLSDARFLTSLLTPTFGPLVRLGDDQNFSFEEGILVTDVSLIKGLEFPNVLVWNPSAKNYRTSRRDRNALYVALTRAEEHLCLVSWGKYSSLLPSIHSPLVRGYDKTEQDE